MLDPLYITEQTLSTAMITNGKMAILRAKYMKSPGTDQLPNELLNVETLWGILKEFFQLCMDTSKILSDWYQVIITPFLMNRENDPLVLLNYREYQKNVHKIGVRCWKSTVAIKKSKRGIWLPNIDCLFIALHTCVKWTTNPWHQDLISFIPLCFNVSNMLLMSLKTALHSNLMKMYIAQL